MERGVLLLIFSEFLAVFFELLDFTANYAEREFTKFRKQATEIMKYYHCANSKRTELFFKQY